MVGGSGPGTSLEQGLGCRQEQVRVDEQVQTRAAQMGRGSKLELAGCSLGLVSALFLSLELGPLFEASP